MSSQTLVAALLILAACSKDNGDSNPGSTDDSSTGEASGSGDDSGGSKVDADKDGYDSTVDCDDTDAAVNPAATEVCDGIDNDCVGGADDGVTTDYFMDGDAEFPTIAGTGTEDYFGGSYNFENKLTKQYQEFTTPYSGLSLVVRPDGVYQSQQRFRLYRWHVTDPIRFERDLKVTIQALGWRSGGRYLPLQDDISSVAYWYQREPHAAFPALPSKDELEIN